MHSFHLLITHAPLPLFLNKTLQKKWRDQDSNPSYCGNNTDHQDETKLNSASKLAKTKVDSHVYAALCCSNTYTPITPINAFNTQSYSQSSCLLNKHRSYLPAGICRKTQVVFSPCQQKNSLQSNYANARLRKNDTFSQK